MSAPGVLIAGIGNLFHGDDGFGVEVAARLAAHPLPPGVAVKDFGIRGLHLAYELLEAYGLVLMVDAVRGNGPPGTLYVLEPAPARAGGSPGGHGMPPSQVLAWARQLGPSPGAIRMIGCEPARIEVDEALIGLSEPVAAAVEPAAALALRIAREFLADGRLPEQTSYRPWPKTL